jgi:poly-gamma-glutamate synthesis protein (capsule biosynthesis protein)
VNKKNTEFNDFTWPFQKTADVLRQADLTFINLETPLVADCEPKLGGMVFCGDLRNTQGLVYAGVDMVNLANNHMGNYGVSGVEQTISALRAAGLSVTGAENPTYMTMKGMKLAFLGYNEVDTQVGITRADTEVVTEQIQAARKEADLVIVQFHWGAEYQYQPTTNQRRLAHLAVENGADLVLGNHPHWWQPPEIYKNKYIMYSHGNFVFDQMWSEETREGLVGRYTFTGRELTNVEYLPVKIEDYGQPRWLEGAEKQTVLDRLEIEKQKLQAIND